MKRAAPRKTKPIPASVPQPAAPPKSSPPPAPASARWLGPLLAVVIVLAYLPVWRAGFIWDDDLHLTANPHMLGAAGLKAIWSSASANYFPLVLSHLWVIHAWFGFDPLPYHLVNVALHVASAWLLWGVLRALAVRGAWLGAALWALHPVQVESVAWISELKNTQSAVFFLLAVRSFLRWQEKTAGRTADGAYALTLLWAVLALLSKASTVMLPVALALCWWWRASDWPWRRWLWLAPFFAFSLATGLWTIWEQKFHSGALGLEWDQTWPERAIIAGRAIWFYLGKLAWPHPLVFIYPRWTIEAAQPLHYLPGVAALAGLAALGAVGLRRGGWARAGFFAAGFFVALLFPVLGFFNVYFFRYSFVADHFQYLASMGPLALLGAGLATLATRAPAPWRRATVAGGAALLLAFA
ncbi:MAG: O-GlcNAc transferase, partial [Verrucomicrobiota bacterium]